MIQSIGEISTELQQLINAELAWSYGVIPASVTAKTLTLYTSETTIVDNIKDDLEIIIGKRVEFEFVSNEIFRKSLGTIYRKSGQQKSNNASEFEGGKDDFLLHVIYEARELGSSDVHIEIYEGKARIRIRIDGHLVEKYKLESEDYPELINKIKIKSNLDITEKRLPQDGRLSFSDFDIRVSILPTLHGEKIVLRILSKDSTGVDLDKLGFETEEKRDYLEGVKRPNGIILISGPTGSGKTTTLYATLKILNDEKRNIMTVEDPIEYTLEGINQVQLKESIGLTFASALRSFLRQDPDIIMLGEIRDGETAQMAIRAALTGHLVLSTIHTNSAWGTISRLIDMGVPPFLLAGTINTSVAQRLIRILCNECKVIQKSNELELPKNISVTELPEHFIAVGCETCHYTGYNGRKAIYEVIHIDKILGEKIKLGELQIDEILKQRKIESLGQKALRLLRSGDTSLEEVYALITNG
ncbi:GspE/PulE family protein [Crocinitomix catalasitica]|uniref:GspE/PulE family protein n=1 Tax=Crocinitomix catalasitica TaxID=184607 RepID=UPI000566B96B|nr:GspE/PulE family protein [Crocinitomix catalasitica]